MVRKQVENDTAVVSGSVTLEKKKLLHHGGHREGREGRKFGGSFARKSKILSQKKFAGSFHVDVGLLTFYTASRSWPTTFCSTRASWTLRVSARSLGTTQTWRSGRWLWKTTTEVSPKCPNGFRDSLRQTLGFLELLGHHVFVGDVSREEFRGSDKFGSKLMVVERVKNDFRPIRIDES
jgi:hypothetical protein